MQENTTRHAEVRHRLVCACARTRTHTHTHKHTRTHGGKCLSASAERTEPEAARAALGDRAAAPAAPLPRSLLPGVLLGVSSRATTLGDSAPLGSARPLCGRAPGRSPGWSGLRGRAPPVERLPGKTPLSPAQPARGGFTQLPPRFKEGAEVNCKDSVPRQRFLTCRQHPAGRLDPGGDCV